MRTLIICSGSISDYLFYNKYIECSDFIICVDGGARHARELNILPNLLIGDFDSIKKSDYDYFSNMGVEVMTFEVEKDMTDTEIAIEIAIERGASSITIIGGTGSRLDHTLANIFLLKKINENKVEGIIANENNEIRLINKKVLINKSKDMKITLLPITERVEGISTKGLYYPLNNYDLEFGTSRGVSNEFLEDTAEISIKKGLLLVITSKD